MPELFVPLPPGVRVQPISSADAQADADDAPWQRCAALAPLAPVLRDRRTTDIFINGSDVFVDTGAGPEAVSHLALTEERTRALATALIAEGGRHIDEAHPCVDVRLEGGVRVHAVLPPISLSGTLVSLRVPRIDTPSLAALEGREMFPPGVGERLRALVSGRENVLVSGAAGAGKTTLLAAMLSEAPPTERIVTIEDVAELRIGHPHHVRLEARQPNLEGAGGVSLSRLVREALRMRPDRLVVGECRGEEVRDLLTALNTGHDGGAGTVHANSLADVPMRLEALGALAGMTEHAVARQVASAIGTVIHVARQPDGVRRVAAWGAPVVATSGRLLIEEQAL